MNKNKVLSFFMIVLLLFIPSLIINSDDLFNNLKIQYTYINSNAEVEFGEISNGQELSILLGSIGDRLLIKIWNYSNAPVILNTDHPTNIIEGQDYLNIPVNPNTTIPKGGSVSFYIEYALYISTKQRGIIEIVTDDGNDEDFEFGLWFGGSSGSGSGGSGGGSDS